MAIVISDHTRIHLSKHPAGRHAASVRDFIVPLAQDYSIEHFAYSKVYKGGSVSLLTTHPGFSEDFTNSGLYKKYFLGSPDQYQSGVYFQDCGIPNEVDVLAAERYHLGHGFTLIKSNAEYCEFFFFATGIDHAGYGNLYLNNMGVFELFSAYFKMKAKALIYEADRNRLEHSCNFSDSLLPGVYNGTEWNQCYFLGLSSRESELLRHLSRYLSQKEVARAMNISLGTVEKHIARIKNKLGCKNMAQLLLTVRGF